MPARKLPQVVIIGRPNVGKSTLFNRLVGKRLALVDDQPGVTRDRRMGNAGIAGLEFEAVDTAGWEDEDDASLPGRMRAQTQVSLKGADAALFVIGMFIETSAAIIVLAPIPKSSVAPSASKPPISWLQPTVAE